VVASHMADNSFLLRPVLTTWDDERQFENAKPPWPKAFSWLLQL